MRGPDGVESAVRGGDPDAAAEIHRQRHRQPPWARLRRETAAPDDDPPGILSRATGLMGAPSTASQPVIEHPSSSMRVTPMQSAPAARSDATAGASRVAGACVAAHAGEPRPVTLPCTSKTSWIANLIPRSGPLAFPFSLSSSWKALRASDRFLHLRAFPPPLPRRENTRAPIDAALARISIFRTISIPRGREERPLLVPRDLHREGDDG